VEWLIGQGLMPLKELATGDHNSGFYGLDYKHQNKLTRGRDNIKRET